MWVCSSAASCPSPPPLPSLCSHPPCGGVVSGGGGVVGVHSTSQVAAYRARDTTATPAEGCVRCCTSPCASLCVLLCRVPRLSSLQHCSIPKDRPPQSYKDHIQQLPAMDHSEALDSTFATRSAQHIWRQMRCISTWSHDSHVTNSGACVGHCYTLRCRLICTGTCICLASLRACVCCFCCLHCSHV